ncbi:unnamed protein product [Adineta ricciae]|uniref:RING-type domain-containing protein n=1 Tax=Adineta ricciae TaxID=249248 RepID=A0A816AZ58_ADIRI|nr:unnamed protein product [Adineta ricciae]
MANSMLTAHNRIEYISSERICNGENVPKELLCPICSGLLWRPHSCASCQNLFCESCISKWLRKNTRCPFGCETYQDRRCSPQIRCLLSNIAIRCQSTPFGCTEIRSYDTLEGHQLNECQYSSIRCRYCEHLMLTEGIETHEQECGQQIGSCHKCNQPFPLCSLEQHLTTCSLNNRQQPLQHFLLPIVDTDAEQEIRMKYANLPWYRRISSLIHLILTNPFDALHIIFIILNTGFFFLVGLVIAGFVMVFVYLFGNIFVGLISVIVFTGLLHFIAPWILSLVNDSSVILFSALTCFFVGCSAIYINAHLLQNKLPIKLLLSMYIGAPIATKIILVLTRLYFLWIPTSVTATFTTACGIFITLIYRYFSSLQQPS